MRRPITLGALLLLAAMPAAAADWDQLVPATTTQPQARVRLGAPTRTEVVKVQAKGDTFDTDRWTYEGAQAPPGITRLVLEFGLKDQRGYHRELLRAFRMEPKPGIFHKGILVKGWGDPDRVGRDDGREVFVWASGLIAYFDTPDDIDPRLLLFGIPQPLPPPAAAPTSPPAPPSSAPPSRPRR